MPRKVNVVRIADVDARYASTLELVVRRHRQVSHEKGAQLRVERQRMRLLWEHEGARRSTARPPNFPIVVAGRERRLGPAFTLRSLAAHRYRRCTLWIVCHSNVRVRDGRLGTDHDEESANVRFIR